MQVRALPGAKQVLEPIGERNLRLTNKGYNPCLHILYTLFRFTPRAKTVHYGLNRIETDPPLTRRAMLGYSVFMPTVENGVRYRFSPRRAVIVGNEEATVTTAKGMTWLA